MGWWLTLRNPDGVRCEAEGGRLLLGSPGPLGVASGASCGASVDGRSSLRMPTQSQLGRKRGEEEVTGLSSVPTGRAAEPGGSRLPIAVINERSAGFCFLVGEPGKCHLTLLNATVKLVLWPITLSRPLLERDISPRVPAAQRGAVVLGTRVGSSAPQGHTLPGVVIQSRSLSTGSD